MSKSEGENQGVFSQHPIPTTSTPTLSSNPSHIEHSRKRKLASVIWNDFGKEKSTNISRPSSRANEKKNDGEVEYRTHLFDQEISQNDLASMIVLHEYPISMVDHFGFRNFVKGLQPMFKMVSRNTIKRDILKIYNSEKEKAYKLLEKLGNRVAITTSLWTDKPTKRAFMAITAHFIDEAWLLQNKILRFIYVPIPHNEDVLSNVLVETMLDWNIDTKQSMITVDNATINDAVVNIILKKLSTSSLLLGGKVLHMHCFARILNIVVDEGLQVLGKGIERIRDSIYYWTATQDRIEKFAEMACQLHISYPKGLVLDVETCWKSTYSMLQTALMYRNVFPRMKQHERHYTSLPTEEDWSLAEEICGKLKLFDNVAKWCSGTNYPTANCYFPKVSEIKEALSHWLESPVEVISVMA